MVQGRKKSHKGFFTDVEGHKMPLHFMRVGRNLMDTGGETPPLQGDVSVVVGEAFRLPNLHCGNTREGRPLPYRRYFCFHLYL